eukprot:COSAG04_NODE_19989_length_403_cov_0.848684_2_plen_82_part_01
MFGGVDTTSNCGLLRAGGAVIDNKRDQHVPEVFSLCFVDERCRRQVHRCHPRRGLCLQLNSSPRHSRTVGYAAVEILKSETD